MTAIRLATPGPRRSLSPPICGRLLALVIFAGLAGLTGPAGAVVASGQDMAAPSDHALVESPLPPSRLKDLDEQIESMMQEWHVPGIAVAIVEDSRVVYSRGFGYRDFEARAPVDPETLFPIGSISKSFAVVALGMLADEGALEWDRPVIDYMPDFRLKDATATLQVTPRDLVTHRSGLPRHDGIWYGASLSREELFERIRYLEPSHRFRSVWQYQNLMFMTAGLLLERLADDSWENFTRRRIFAPLGMERSTFTIDDMVREANHALPYVVVDIQVTRVPFRVVDAIGPAGSINSNVEELIRFVQLHLDRGQWGDRRLLSGLMADQMRQPQVVIPRDTDPWDEIGYDSYGMGLVVGTYRGHKILHHGGGIDGFISLMSMMPSRRLGMVILSNQAGNNPVPSLLSRIVYDRMLDLQPIDWVARGKSSNTRTKATRSTTPPPRPGTSPSHPMDEYAGTFEHPGYGRVRIDSTEDGLRMTFNGMSTRLDHFHYDVFASPEDPLNPLENLKVLFLYDRAGEIDRLHVPMEPAVPDIEFRRIGDHDMLSRERIAQIVGTYRSPGEIIHVEERPGPAIWLRVGGQPSYELVPHRDKTYRLNTLEGYSVEFIEDGGLVTGLTLRQPNGTVTADRQ